MASAGRVGGVCTATAAGAGVVVTAVVDARAWTAWEKRPGEEPLLPAASVAPVAVLQGLQRRAAPGASAPTSPFIAMARWITDLGA